MKSLVRSYNLMTVYFELRMCSLTKFRETDVVALENGGISFWIVESWSEEAAAFEKIWFLYHPVKVIELHMAWDKEHRVVCY